MYIEFNKFFGAVALLIGFFFLWVLPFVIFFLVGKEYNKYIKEKSMVQNGFLKKKIQKIIFVTLFLNIFFLMFSPNSCGDHGCGLAGFFLLLFVIINFGVFAIASSIGLWWFRRTSSKKEYDQNPQAQNNLRK